jgi:hypothetical protein
MSIDISSDEDDIKKNLKGLLEESDSDSNSIKKKRIEKNKPKID